MAEKFLILGASSFYGSNFAKYVEERGDVAIRLARPEWDMRDGIDVDTHMPDYIVNFVSQSLVAESWDDPAKWVSVNTGLTAEFLRTAVKYPRTYKKFIHVSTPESYGHTEGWVDETYAAWKPSTPYGVSRAAGDMMLMAYHRAFGFPAIITRTANIYGPGQGKNRIIPLAFDTLERGEKLLLHGNGYTMRAFIHIKDACAGLYLAATKGSVGQTYHISTRTEISIANLVKRVAKILGVHTPNSVGTQPDRVGKDLFYGLLSARIRHMGWSDKISLDKGLQDYAASRVAVQPAEPSGG